MKRGLVVAGILIIGVLAVWLLVRRPGGRPGNGNGGDRQAENGSQLDESQRLDLMRTALAETENLNPQNADPLWQQLLEDSPGNLDALQNLVVTRVSRIDQLKRVLESPNATPEERTEAREALPEQIALAREAAASLAQQATAASDESRLDAAVWLDAKIDNLAAVLQPFDQRQAVMQATADKLADRLDQSPSAIRLTGLLQDSAEMAQDPIAGPDAETAKRLAEVFSKASDADPRNLFVALAALDYRLAAQDPEATELVQRVADQTDPLDFFIRRSAQQQAGMEPEQLLKTITDAIDAGDFRTAGAWSRRWGNLIRATSAFRSDLRRASVNALDLVATRSINELSRSLAVQDLPPLASQRLQFADPLQIAESEAAVVAMHAVDVDLSGGPELLVATANQLSIWKPADDGWNLWAEIEIPDQSAGITVADLFLVDASFDEMIKRSYGDDEGDPGTNSRRHSVFPSILVWGAYGLRVVRLDGRTETAADQRLWMLDAETGMEEVAQVVAVEPFDLDADGDLDLALSTLQQGVQLWVNRDNMTFFSVSDTSELPPSDDPVRDFALVDLDRDLDVDLLTIQESGQVGWLENLLHMQMRFAPFESVPAAQPGRAIAAVEWDGNVSWDALYSGVENLGLMRTETTAAGVFELTETELRGTGESDQSETNQSGTNGTVGGQLLVADFENDAWSDVLVYGANGAGVVRGAPEAFTTLTLTRLTDQPVSAACIADFDSDGALDLCYAAQSQVLFRRNSLDQPGHFVTIQMKGIDDNATGRVNHYAIGSTHELRFGPHYRAAVVSERNTRFGLGIRTQADTLRTILTNGITQNIIDPPVDTTIVEEQTLKGSCPYLYTWDGEKFAFVSDCLWAAPLGLQFAMGQVVPDRPWEYLKVDGRFLEPRDGHYELRLTEELWEIAYFDQVELIAIDHPADIEIWTNEKVGPPELVQPKIYTFEDASPVRGAVDTRGEDVTELLSRVDDRYVQGFDARLRQGLCPTHWIELDLGEVKADDRLFLVLTGWILPTDTSLNIQIDQNPQLPAVQPPSVLIPDGAGGWKESIPVMGFPGGKTKTIVVPLTGKLNLDDPRVRIQTSAQIYWDAAKIVVNPPDVKVVSHSLDMVTAEVGFHGFSQQLPRNSTQPHRYDYHLASQGPKWPPLDGGLTQFGDCARLLTDWDDSMVVIAGGDEIRLRFKVPEQSVPEGWRRDFVLHCVGWDKDADLNTLAGQSSDPLPFRNMEKYPAGPKQTEAQTQVHRRNAVHRTRTQSFRNFWHRPGVDAPR